MGTVSSVKAHGGSPKYARSDFHPLKQLGLVHSNLIWGSLLISVSFYQRFSFLFQLLYIYFLFCYSPMFYSDPLIFLTFFLLFSPQIQSIVHATILLRSMFYLKILGSSSAVDLPFATLSWVSVHLLGFISVLLTSFFNLLSLFSNLIGLLSFVVFFNSQYSNSLPSFSQTIMCAVSSWMHTLPTSRLWLIVLSFIRFLGKRIVSGRNRKHPHHPNCCNKHESLGSWPLILV